MDHSDVINIFLGLFILLSLLFWVIFIYVGIYGLYKLGKRWSRQYMQYILPVVFVVVGLFWVNFVAGEVNIVLTAEGLLLAILSFGVIILRERRQRR